jgi:hypothetical protein
MRFWFVLLIIMVLIQACLPTRDTSTTLSPFQPSVTPTLDGRDNPSPPPSTQPSETPTLDDSDSPPQALPDGAVIVYRRSGGIAGLDETFTIYQDGRITSSDGGEWYVSPQDLQDLMKQIKQVGFFQVEQTGPFNVPCCDRFSYTLTVNLEGKTHTVQTYDGAVDQPESVQSAINAINTFLIDKKLPDR